MIGQEGDVRTLLQAATLAIIVVINFSGAASAAHRCTSAPAASGPAWTPVIYQGHAVEGLFYAQAQCPEGYRPVSGGVRYEGVWADPDYARNWQQVVSTPYDETPLQEATAWRCMVLAAHPATAQSPSPLWCTAVCCHWDD